MKRCAKMIVLFVLAGAIINVAVAEFLAAWIRVSPEFVKAEISSHSWRAYVGDALVNDSRTQYHECVVGRGIGYRYVMLDAGFPSPPYSFQSWVVQGYHQVVRVGWPMLSMEADRPLILNASHPWAGVPVVAGHIDLGITQLRDRPLAAHPIWPGFAINTIFYAAILWLPVAGLGALRRRRRVKRGLCPACAYPVGTSAVCTECGRAVKT